jgi:AcrR family transcriptional regulator
MPSKALTREEAKSITRGRLIEAALKLASQGGGGGLTASQVAREAGVAQPTFYVHFKDRDDLLFAVGESQIGKLKQAVKGARTHIDLDALTSGHADSALREAFRVPVEAIVRQGVLFRLYVQERAFGDSPLGRQCRQLADELRADLVEDLRRVDEHTGRNRSHLELQMLADGVGGLTEALGLGYLDGRYTDLEAMIDVLVRFTRDALI